MGAAASLAISDIPFDHVLGAVRVAIVGGKMVAEPSYDEIARSRVHDCRDRNRAWHRHGGSRRIGCVEDKVVDAIEFGHECCRKIIAGIRELQSKAGKQKRVYTPAEIDQELYDKIATQVTH